MLNRFHLLMTAAALALAAPGHAANLALVIDAGEEENARSGLNEALEAGGYEITEVEAADRDAMREAIAAVAERLDEAERIVLVFAGPVWAREGRVVLLPADFEGETPIDAAFDGVSFDLMLDIAATRPGRSAVIVAWDDPPEDEVEALETGDEEEAAEAAAAEAAEAAQAWSRAEVPQGVLVLAGPRAAAMGAAAERLLAPDVTVAEAVAGLDEDLRVYGFASPDVSFAEAPETAEAPAIQPEPEPEAVAAPEPMPEPTPEELAEEGEAALALDQTARRAIQEDLYVLGHSTRGIDGIFGPGTRTAIREWQEAEGEDATGYLDAEQVARLRDQATARTAELREEAERVRAEEEAADAAFWRTTGAGGAAADLRAYLARYPDGIYAAEARAQLDAMEAEARAEAEGADRAAWDAALAEGTEEALRGYLDARPDGAFAAEAEARIAEIEAAPALEAARAEAASREEALGLNTASRALIESQLAAVGHDVGVADGGFDDDTRRAIREFQTRQGLEPTGYVDQATVQALIVASLGLR